MKHTREKPITTKRKVLLAIAAVVLLAAGCLGGYAIYGTVQMQKIPGLSFQEALAYTLRGSGRAVITVGVVSDGQASFTVYGKDGAILPDETHIYEIGSLTKTFTAALIEMGVAEGRISLDDTVGMYLDLPDGNLYPTIRQLLTHTAGYKAYYFESPMIGNFLCGRNDFCGIGGDLILNRLSRLSTIESTYAFRYSNFGFATLGLVLESVYGESYTTLVNRFAGEELGLHSTHISDGNGDLTHYWDWETGDAYLAAGGLTSNITDMLAYAQLQLSEQGVFGECHKPLVSIDASTESYQKMGIRLDEIGMSWIIDDENGVVWHNGGTDDYNCYLGFQAESGTAVVILSNLPPSERIPATVLGVKLLSELCS
ncbi:MAG TPA: serine hydrolase domain-containing protein [Eubacteriales bacterium]|nr:serine hydrolase domain-containing protein [Eubacteriales bacterium]